MPLAPIADEPIAETTKSGGFVGGNMLATPPWATVREMAMKMMKADAMSRTTTGGASPVRQSHTAITDRPVMAPPTAIRYDRISSLSSMAGSPVKALRNTALRCARPIHRVPMTSTIIAPIA